eukprot:2979131-Rhodomonas_salina.1
MKSSPEQKYRAAVCSTNPAYGDPVERYLLRTCYAKCTRIYRVVLPAGTNQAYITTRTSTRFSTPAMSRTSSLRMKKIGRDPRP